jgi:hypothetical protein
MGGKLSDFDQHPQKRNLGFLLQTLPFGSISPWHFKCNIIFRTISRKKTRIVEKT